MLSLGLVIVLGGTKVTASATGGLTLATQERADTSRVSVLGQPLLAARLEVAKTWAVGTFRGRLVPLVIVAPTTPNALPANAAVMAAIQLNDLGSFIEFESSRLGTDGPTLAVRLTPFQANTRLVSFDWANAVTRVNAPVLSVDLRCESWHGWIAGRFPVQGAVVAGAESFPVLYPEVLGGVGWRDRRFRVEVRAGRTQYGRATGPPAMPSVNGALQWGFLAAGQVVFHLGEEVPAALDLFTYGQDPSRFERFFSPPPVAEGNVVLTASLELGGGTQSLSRGGMAPTESEHLPGWLDLQARLRIHQTRFFLTARAQSFAFLTFDFVSPGGFSAFRPISESTPLLAGYLGVDHVFQRANLVPQLLLRVVQPATARTQVGFGGAAPPPGNGGVVLREVGPAEFRSLDGRLEPTVGAKLALRWHPVPALAVVGEVDVAMDLMTQVLAPRPGMLVPGVRPAVSTTSTVALQGRF